LAPHGGRVVYLKSGGVVWFFMPYSHGFKSRMVQRMTGPEAISANALSHEVGLSQSTLSRWLRHARTVGSMVEEQSNADNKSKSTREWTAEQRRQIVAEAKSLADDELGAFLRGNGIHMTQLEQWRAQDNEVTATPAQPANKKRTRKVTAEQRRIRELETKLRRTEKKLRAANALLDLQKKVREIWGDEDDDTPTRSET